MFAISILDKHKHYQPIIITIIKVENVDSSKAMQQPSPVVSKKRPSEENELLTQGNNML